MSLTPSSCCSREIREHCFQRPTRIQVFGTVTFLVLFFGALFLVFRGYVQLAADLVREHTGLWAHAIFFGMVFYTGFFFAYGWTIIIIASGYTLGWWAVLTMYTGTLLGAACGFTTSRYCMRDAIKRKIASLPPKWSRRITFFQSELTRSWPAHIVMSAMIRNSNALTFGMANGTCPHAHRLPTRDQPYHASSCFLGCNQLYAHAPSVRADVAAIDGVFTDVTLWRLLLTVMIVSSHNIVLFVYVGVLLQSVLNDGGGSGDGGSSNVSISSNATGTLETGETTQRQVIIVQIIVACILLVGIMFWSQRRLRAMERASHERSRRADELAAAPPA